MTRVELIATADRQLRALRGNRRNAALRVLTELESRGCSAAGYRLAGELFDQVCCRHLYGTDRMLILWSADDHAVVVAIAPHDGSHLDVYDTLADALGLAVSVEERSKPPCCDEASLPPVDEEIVSTVSDALRRAARRRR